MRILLYLTFAKFSKECSGFGRFGNREPATIFIASSDLLCCLCQNWKKNIICASWHYFATFCVFFFFVEFWNGSRLSFVFREYFAILFGKNLVILPTTVKFCWSKIYFQTFSGIFLQNYLILLCVWAVIYCEQYFAILSNKAQLCSLWSIDQASCLLQFLLLVFPDFYFLFSGILEQKNPLNIYSSASTGPPVQSKYCHDSRFASFGQSHFNVFFLNLEFEQKSFPSAEICYFLVP